MLQTDRGVLCCSAFCLVEAASQSCCDVSHAQLIAACHSLTGHCCSCTPWLFGLGSRRAPRSSDEFRTLQK